MEKEKNTRGEIITLVAITVMILIGVTTFIASTFLNKNNKKLTYQSKAREPKLCNSACETCNPGDDEYSDPEECSQPTSKPEPQPQPTSIPEAPSSCECVDRTYQGSGCGAGQIGEQCSNAENLSCFDQCLTDQGGVEACNKECNKLENNNQLVSPTPGAGGNVCGKVGETPNDLYGCCPGLVEDPDTLYCRYSVSVGRPTPTPNIPIPSPTSVINEGLPPGSRCSENSTCSSGLCSPTPYGYYCASDNTSKDCGGTETVCNGSVIMKCVNGGYVRSGSCAGGCDDSGGSAICSYVSEANITPPPKGCMGGQAVTRGTVCFGCFGLTGDWGSMPEEYCKPGATITDADLINKTTDPNKRSEFRQAGWEKFANDDKNSTSDKTVAKISQGLDMFSNWWGSTTTNLSSNIAKLPVLGGASQLLLGFDPEAVYKDSQFEKYLGANLAANAVNPDRQRCGNLESVIDMLSGPAGAKNAQKRGCTDQIRDAVIVGGLSGGEHAIGSIPIIGPLISPITEGISNGVVDLYFGSNKAEAEAAKSAMTLGSEVIAPVTTAYNVVALGEVIKELAKVTTRVTSKAVIKVASNAGYDALKNGNLGKATTMKSIIERAGKIYDLAVPELRVVPIETPQQASNLLKRALESATKTGMLPRLRANMGQSVFGKTLNEFRELFPKTAKLIRKKLYGNEVRDAKESLASPNN